jgi:hypothetical protein
MNIFTVSRFAARFVTELFNAASLPKNNAVRLPKTWHVTLLLLAISGAAVGQVRDDYYHPLSQNSPPGLAAGWLNAIRQYDPAWMQPLSIEMDGGGQIDVFAGSPQPVAGDYSPALVAVNVGHIYRLRVSSMPAFPGLEVFPTVELLDRLHPPAGRDNEFPIPIILTKDDVRTALTGQLVTRIIYLEQPQIAQALDPLRRELPQSVLPKDNSLKEADRLGRPMAIIRIGGRRPSGNSPASFYGNGGSVQLRTPVADSPAPATVHRNTPQAIQQTSAQLPRQPLR